MSIFNVSVVNFVKRIKWLNWKIVILFIQQKVDLFAVGITFLKEMYCRRTIERYAIAIWRYMNRF